MTRGGLDHDRDVAPIGAAGHEPKLGGPVGRGPGQPGRQVGLGREELQTLAGDRPAGAVQQRVARRIGPDDPPVGMHEGAGTGERCGRRTAIASIRRGLAAKRRGRHVLAIGRGASQLEPPPPTLGELPGAGPAKAPRVPAGRPERTGQDTVRRPSPRSVPDAWGHHARLVRADDQLRPIARPELGEQPRDVGLGGERRDDERLGDLGVGGARADQR